MKEQSNHNQPTRSREEKSQPWFRLQMLHYLLSEPNQDLPFWTVWWQGLSFESQLPNT